MRRNIEPPEPKPIQMLLGALLKETEPKVSIAENLPENVQAQYIPRQRTIFVRNGVSEEVTQEFMADEFSVSEGMKGEVQTPEIPKPEEPAEKPPEQKGRKSKKHPER